MLLLLNKYFEIYPYIKKYYIIMTNAIDGMCWLCGKTRRDSIRNDNIRVLE